MSALVTPGQLSRTWYLAAAISMLVSGSTSRSQLTKPRPILRGSLAQAIASPNYCAEFPPIASRAYNAESLGPQRHQRIDPSGAARGKPARKRRYREQRRRNPDKRQWIRRRHAIQNSLHETRERQRGD
jgi:hypothetical protein